METALVTGAGAGTGKEYVRLLLADGARVVAVSLLENELDDLLREFAGAGDRLMTRQADLAEPNGAEKLLAWCDEHDLVVDTLINNAGFAVYGDPLDVDLDKVEKMLMLNVIGSTKISTLFGRRMKERGSGRILVMGSTAGMMPTMRFAAYCASKAYTNMFTQCLGAALAESGVSITLVTPGSFKSKFAASADLESSMSGGLMPKLFAKEKLEASSVARAGYAAMRSARPAVTVGAKGHIARIGGRLFSPSWLARQSHRL